MLSLFFFFCFYWLDHFFVEIMRFKSSFFVYAAIAVAVVVSVFLFVFSGRVRNTDEDYRQAMEQNYRIFSVHIPDTLLFAGERVPLEQYDVYERMDRELLVNTYWQSQTMLFFKRANRWFPLIEPILKEQGIPDDFKYLALIESGLLNVGSPAGAVGFWQLLESTAKELGLEVNQEVDERYHVEKATRAACKYLLESKRQFGNWTMAAAAYNMGRAGLSRQVSSQKANDYYQLWLNDETSRYVFRILAIKCIFENPKGHGFYFRNKDLYQPIDYITLNVDTPVSNLVDFARLQGTDYKGLRYMNPWLRQPSLSNKLKKSYEIKIPRSTIREPLPDDEADTLFLIQNQENIKGDI